MPEQAEYQKRVIAEKQELDEKLIRLTDFLNSDALHTLDSGERDRLRYQELLMKEYSQVLGLRIGAFRRSNA